MILKNKHFYLVILWLCFALPMAKIHALESSVIIGFHQAPGPSEQALIETAGGTVDRVYRLIPAIVATLPEQALTELAVNPLVAYIEENTTVSTIEPSYTSLSQSYFYAQSITTQMIASDVEYQATWSVERIGSKIAHDKGITGKEIKVAVIDTGIDYNHEDLAANYRGGYDFIFNDLDPMDDSWNSHGTHIAGIIGAAANGTGAIGVAPEVGLYAVKSLDAGGFGSLDTIVAGIQWAVDNNMDIINLSLTGLDSPVLQEASDAAYAAGVLIVAAAGNTFSGAVTYPAAYDSVIAVTGTDLADQRGFFSPIDPRVELAAPGLAIWSTSQYSSFIELSGTSQAAAHVSGTAALVMAAGIGDINNDGMVDNRDVRQQLQTTALDLGVLGRDEEYGFGMVNVAEAVVMPPILLNLMREPSWFNSLETASIENAPYLVTIENDSLNGVFVLVIENHRLRRDLVKSHFFTGPPSDNSQPFIFELDATNTQFEVVFIPIGNIGSSASVTIQKQ